LASKAFRATSSRNIAGQRVDQIRREAPRVGFDTDQQSRHDNAESAALREDALRMSS
jgi:hypothetical protein